MLFVCAFLLLGVWRVIGTPNHMNAYALDPRSKPELRTRCEICHARDGKPTDARFLGEFGAAWKAANYRISTEMRDRYPALFIGRDVPVNDLPPDTISTTTEQVVINVTVRDGKGHYVPGLGRGDFKLLEDDREQEVQQFFGEDTPLAVAVLLDTSGSTLQKDLDRARNTILDFAKRLQPDDVLAIYSFGESGIEQIRDFSSTVGDIKPLLKTVRPRGNTPLYDAILQATDELRNRPERRRVIILISDGADSESKTTQREAEVRTFRAGVSLYAIDLINTQREAKRSVDRQAAAATLRQLAEETGGRYISSEGGPWWLTNRSRIKRIFNDLIDELHKQYTLGYEPENARRSGRWRTIRVEMGENEFDARSRLGYRESNQ
ncbi:MAG: VWA domain-containing protein [Blastocatellia bacterium]